MCSVDYLGIAAVNCSRDADNRRRDVAHQDLVLLQTVVCTGSLSVPRLARMHIQTLC